MRNGVSDVSTWVSVVTPPPSPGQPWRGLLLRLTPHAGTRTGHYWWRLTPETASTSAATSVRRFLDDDGEICAVEVLSESRQDLGAVLESVGLDPESLGSPTLFYMPSVHPTGDGWVWTFR